MLFYSWHDSNSDALKVIRRFYLNHYNKKLIPASYRAAVECATPSKWFPWLLVPLSVYQNASNIGEGAVNDVGGGGFKARGMEDEEVKVNPEMGQFPLSRRRDFTAVLVVPTFSRKLYCQGGEIPPPSLSCPHFPANLARVNAILIAACCCRTYSFVREAKALAGGGVSPSATLTVPIAMVCDSDISQWGVSDEIALSHTSHQISCYRVQRRISSGLQLSVQPAS
jgi:hypothetical protein